MSPRASASAIVFNENNSPASSPFCSDGSEVPGCLPTGCRKDDHLQRRQLATKLACSQFPPQGRSSPVSGLVRSCPRAAPHAPQPSSHEQHATPLAEGAPVGRFRCVSARSNQSAGFAGWRKLLRDNGLRLQHPSPATHRHALPAPSLTRKQGPEPTTSNFLGRRGAGNHTRRYGKNCGQHHAATFGRGDARGTWILLDGEELPGEDGASRLRVCRLLDRLRCGGRGRAGTTIDCVAAGIENGPGCTTSGSASKVIRWTMT
jgi:hypothetical protein